MRALKWIPASLLLAGTLATTFASSLAAQDTGNGFMFGNPLGSVGLRGGWAIASARSDLFSFTTDQLTLKRGDFSSPTIGVDAAVRVFGDTHLMASLDFSGMDKRSEDRRYIDNNNLPIEQVTRFRRMPITASVKQYITTPGRSIGRFAWVPSRFATYVGAGGGIEWYQFRQSGDFVDYQTLDVFSDSYSSDGWTSEMHAFAGIDYSIRANMALTTEARYSHSNAELSNDFSGFGKLDLSGFTTTVGLTFRF